MEPVVREDHNFCFGPPPGKTEDEVGKLSVRIVKALDWDGQPEIVLAHYKPSEEELLALNAGGHIELGIWTRPIPPVSLHVVESRPELSDEETGEPGWKEGHDGPDLIAAD